MKVDFNSIKASVIEFYNKTIAYFKSLTTDKIIAWSAIGVGLLLVIIAIIIW